MPETGNKLGAWQQTRNVLVETLAMNSELQASVPFSNDPNSEFQQLSANIDRLISALQAHALNGLKIVDQAIATSSIIESLRESSHKAKDEVNRLRNTTRTVQNITQLVDIVGGVVDDIAGILI